MATAAARGPPRARWRRQHRPVDRGQEGVGPCPYPALAHLATLRTSRHALPSVGLMACHRLREYGVPVPCPQPVPSPALRASARSLPFNLERGGSPQVGQILHWPLSSSPTLSLTPISPRCDPCRAVLSLKPETTNLAVQSDAMSPFDVDSFELAPCIADHVRQYLSPLVSTCASVHIMAPTCVEGVGEVYYFSSCAA